MLTQTFALGRRACSRGTRPGGSRSTSPGCPNCYRVRSLPRNNCRWSDRILFTLRVIGAEFGFGPIEGTKPASQPDSIGLVVKHSRRANVSASPASASCRSASVLLAWDAIPPPASRSKQRDGHHGRSRRARSREITVPSCSRSFHNSVSRGFCGVGDNSVAVCVLPGTEIGFEADIAVEGKTLTCRVCAVLE